jgi:predicted nucleotidyltransferase
MSLVTLSEIDKSQLQQVADRYQLDLIVLFGSYARGTARPDSDLDVAVHTTRPDYARRDPDEEAFWEMDLFADLSAIFKPPEGLDLVVLNRADSTLLYEVARYGLPFYQREPGGFHQFRSYAARRFYDDAKFRRWGWEYLKRRCLDGERSV